MKRGITVYTISTLEITLRLLAAVFVGGVIGYEREENRQAAGLRTNIIVSVSACLITLIQLEIGYYSLNLAIANPDIASSITVDFTRIIAQIVSGIGFLGAGTILITKRDTVTGLTSAATIWTVAGLGITVGMGYYFLSVIGCLILYIVLHIIKKIRTSIGGLHVEVHYRHQDLKKVIELFLSENNIETSDMKFLIENPESEHPNYIVIYGIDLPHYYKKKDLVNDLLNMSKDITNVTFDQ